MKKKKVAENHMGRVIGLVLLIVAANEVTYPSVATLIGQKQQRLHQQCLEKRKTAYPFLGIFNS